MSSVVIAGDVSGTVTLQAPSAAGSTVLSLPSTSGTILTTAGGTATTATNVAGGVAGNVHYQTGVGTTGFVTNGTSGQVLLSNGAAAPVWGAVAGNGGQTVTGNLTLTSASAAAITVTPSSLGLYVTLPNATTCTKADNLFSIYNAGEYDYGVKDSTGTQLGWIRGRTGAMIGLSDNTTPAGTWAYYGLEKTGLTANYVSPLLANMGSGLIRITLDANRFCLLFGGTDCYAIVYDASTQTWGSPTLIRATIGTNFFTGVLSATNQVLVCTSDTTTGMQTVTLTISGTTITVNTPVSTTLAGNFSNFFQLIPVSTSWVVSYTRASTTSAIRAITVSGTTPTVGAESTLQTTGAVAYPLTIFASGSIVRTVATDSGGFVLRVTPFTVSGSTLTAGTGTTVAFTGTGQFSRTFLNGNGNIVCQYTNGTTYASVFKLTGTTETASTVNLGGTVPNASYSGFDYQAISASKTLFVSASNGTQIDFNILTDTAGTATAGTVLTYSTNLGAYGVAGLFTVGSIGYVGIVNTNGTRIYGMDCSGASPTVASDVQTTAFGISGSDTYGVKNSSYVFFGTSKMTTASIGNYSVVSPYWSVQSSARTESQYGSGGGTISDGANGRFLSGTNAINASVGVGFQRIEAAA